MPFKTSAKSIVSDDELTKAAGNANFGATPLRKVLAYGVLQTACGYTTGSTLREIMLELELVSAQRNPRKPPRLLKKGREYLWAAFGKDSY